jgi:hypothetical protein
VRRRHPADNAEVATTRDDEAGTDFADVPGADLSAEIDPHWVQLRGDSLLPALYMPPPMAGSHPGWMRVVATGLISIFLLATGLGVCLTYGSPIGLF